MENISPKLLADCQKAFEERFNDSSEIRAIIERIRNEEATTKDAGEYARIVGEILGQVLGENITFDVLPDGKLFWNIANDVIKPLISRNYDMVSIVSTECQQIAYRSAGIGISVKKPKLDNERVKGLLNDVCEDGIDSGQLKERLESDVENITESFNDDFVQENASSASSVGLKTKVIRTTGSSGCCAWCESLAGVYDYEDVKDKGNDVWLRHTNCTCDITYMTEKYSETVQNYKTSRKKK